MIVIYIMSDKELKVRLLPDSNDDKTMSNMEIFKSCTYLGLTCFGGPIAHIGLFEKEFIKEKKVISQSTFSQLFALANITPGPTSSQLLVAIAIVKTKSILGGIISFLCFNMPGLLFMIFIAQLIEHTPSTWKLDSETIKIAHSIAVGICQGAVAIVFQAALSLSLKIRSSNYQITFLITSAIVYLIFNKYETMLILMIISGYFSMMIKEDKFLVHIPQKIYELNNVRFIGLPALITFFVIYFITFFSNYFFSGYSINFYLMECFYRIGALVIGGGHVVIPMVMNELEGLLSRTDVLNAFTIVSLLPGPMFNIAGYLGALINGVFSGFLAAFFIFLPGMLLLFANLRIMSWVNEKPQFQFFLRGVSSSAIGFIFTSAVILWYDSCFRNIYYHCLLGTLNFLGCFIMLEKFKLNVLLVLFIAGIFGILAHIIPLENLLILFNFI